MQGAAITHTVQGLDNTLQLSAMRCKTLHDFYACHMASWQLTCIRRLEHMPHALPQREDHVNAIRHHLAVQHRAFTQQCVP